MPQPIGCGAAAKKAVLKENKTLSVSNPVLCSFYDQEFRIPHIHIHPLNINMPLSINSSHIHTSNPYTNTHIFLICICISIYEKASSCMRVESNANQASSFPSLFTIACFLGNSTNVKPIFHRLSPYAGEVEVGEMLGTLSCCFTSLLEQGRWELRLWLCLF